MHKSDGTPFEILFYFFFSFLVYENVNDVRIMFSLKIKLQARAIGFEYPLCLFFHCCCYFLNYPSKCCKKIRPSRISSIKIYNFFSLNPNCRQITRGLEWETYCALMPWRNQFFKRFPRIINNTLMMMLHTTNLIIKNHSWLNNGKLAIIRQHVQLYLSSEIISIT